MSTDDLTTTATGVLEALRRYLRALAASDDRGAGLYLWSVLYDVSPPGTGARVSLGLLRATPEECGIVADELMNRVIALGTSGDPDIPDAVQVTLRWPPRRRVQILAYLEANRWRFLPGWKDTTRLRYRIGIAKPRSARIDVDLPDED